MAKEEQEVASLTPEQLLKQETDLKTQSEELEKEKEAFEKEKSDFLNKKKEFEQIKSAFETTLTNFKTEKEAFEKKNSELKKREKALEQKQSAATLETEPGLEFEFEDQKYKFSDSAPKTILLNGKGRTQKEIVENEDLLVLVLEFGLKSGLIVKIK